MDTDTCGICKNEIEIVNKLLTPCKHVFCGECFFKWMERKTNCPICRKDFGNAEMNSDIVETEIRLERLTETSREWEEYINYLREKSIEADVLMEAKNAEYKLLFNETRLQNEKLTIETEKVRVKTEELRALTENLRVKTYIVNSINMNISRSNYRNKIHNRRFGLQLQ